MFSLVHRLAGFCKIYQSYPETASQRVSHTAHRSAHPTTTMSLFLAMAQLADELAATGSKLKKRAAIAQALVAAREAGGLHDAGLFALYLSGTPFAEADPRKLNIGGAMMTRVVREISTPTEAQFGAAWRRHGDLGAAAGDLWAEKGYTPESSIEFAQVEASFAGIAMAKTTAIRQRLLTELLTRAIPVEAKYLIKLMLGDMRIGVKQALVEEAVAVASEQPLANVRNAVMLEADLAGAVGMAFEARLAEARMRLFHPLGFMLASPVETAEEAVKRFAATPESAAAAEVSVVSPSVAEPRPIPVAEDEDAVSPETAEALPVQALHIEALIEDKFDGMRVQLHCGDRTQPGRVAMYSRNREDVTESWPDVAEAFAHAGFNHLDAGRSIESEFHLSESRDATSNATGLILDGEVLAWDVVQARALPFSVLSPRLGRKRVTNEIRRGTPAVFMAFDLLCEDGQLLLDLPLRERRARLEAVAEKLEKVALSPLEVEPLPPRGGLFDERRNEAPAGEQRFLLSAVSLATSSEDLDRAYVAARDRGNEGVMIKASGSLYQPGRRGLSWLKLKRHLDTLDVVITGAEYGSGRKSQVLSDYTFAVRDEHGDLQNVGKAYSGVTDVEIVELTEWLKAHTLEDNGHFRTVEPQVILEVAFNNIMRSDRHSSGFALRFPRIVQIRRDKPLAEIDTVARVEEIYQSQPDKPAEEHVA